MRNVVAELILELLETREVQTGEEVPSHGRIPAPCTTRFMPVIG